MTEDLRFKIKVLNELMWERRLPWNDVEQWLTNFAPTPDSGVSEQLHALYLLSHFSFFNSTVMRVLLGALYRDLVQYPIVAKLRRRRKNTLDWAVLAPSYDRELNKIRFIGIGNPSESGTHLLYYFRQENGLGTNLFVHPHELFTGSPALPRIIPGVRRLIFLDDFCGSGSQAIRYSKQLLQRIRGLNADIRLSYFPLFATSKGLGRVRNKTLFNDIETICELDDTFQAVEPHSRYFRDSYPGVFQEFAKEMCARYGSLLQPATPLGFGGCQLLLGFAHNIPNNTLPIFWAEGGQGHRWTPIFRRYMKGGW